MSTGVCVPILLLKTKSQPNDAYEEHLRSLPTHVDTASPLSLSFSPEFIPVLEHKPNADNLSHLAELLRSGRLKEKYGGMIFTSQRAVEAWADTVAHVEGSMLDSRMDSALNSFGTGASPIHTATDTRTNEPFQTDILLSTPFPLYSVGPATSRALDALVSPPTKQPHSFTSLNPVILGSHTGNGAALAQYIQRHYNTLHTHNWFTWYEAPRLPYVPLLGMGSENYSRRRLESDDPRLRKRPLLFLVGEQRRDIIPKTLMHDLPVDSQARIETHEVEVYRTDLRGEFTGVFSDTVQRIDADERVKIAVAVVFSPQGAREMLRTLGLVDEYDRATPLARMRWHVDPSAESAGVVPGGATRYIVVTIGPTTQDYLRDTFGFEADVCASKPSPEGVRNGVEAFLEEKGLL